MPRASAASRGASLMAGPQAAGGGRVECPERGEQHGESRGLRYLRPFVPMSHVTITLPDGSTRDVAPGTSIRDFAAAALPQSVVKKALAATVDGRMVDL